MRAIIKKMSMINTFCLLMFISLYANAQVISFKRIIDDNNPDALFSYKDSLTGNKSELKYLGCIYKDSAKYYIINHQYLFKTAGGSTRKNERFWVMTNEKSLGYYMIMGKYDSLPVKIDHNRYLIFNNSEYWGKRKVDFSKKFPNCFFKTRQLCFTKREFKLSREPSKNWFK